MKVDMKSGKRKKVGTRNTPKRENPAVQLNQGHGGGWGGLQVREFDQSRNTEKRRD